VTSADLARYLAYDRIFKTNLLANGDFSVAASNWAEYGTPAASAQDATKVVTGDFSWLLTPNAANEGIQSDAFTTSKEDVLYGRFQVYPDDGTVVSMILVSGDGTTVLLAKTFTGLTENAWNILEYSIKETVGGTGAYLVLHSGAQTSGDFYFGDSFMSKLNGQGQILARKASGARITIAENDIRWAQGGTTPTMEATGKLGHIVVDPDVIFLDNFDAVKNFQYVSNVTGTAGSINITPEF